MSQQGSYYSHETDPIQMSKSKFTEDLHIPALAIMNNDRLSAEPTHRTRHETGPKPATFPVAQIFPTP